MFLDLLLEAILYPIAEIVGALTAFLVRLALYGMGKALVVGLTLGHLRTETYLLAEEHAVRHGEGWWPPTYHKGGYVFVRVKVVELTGLVGWLACLLGLASQLI